MELSWFSRVFSWPSRDLPVPYRRMRAVVGEKHIVDMEAQYVDEARDYESVVAKIAKISDGALVFDQFSCTEEAGARRLVLGRGDVITSGLLAGDTDWIDEKGLLAILNDAVGDRRLVDLAADPAFLDRRLVSPQLRRSPVAAHSSASTTFESGAHSRSTLAAGGVA